MDSIIIEHDLDYKSNDIKKIVKQMWQRFYEKTKEHKFKTRMALWTITGVSCAFDVNPISPKPDEYEESPFIITTGVDGLYPLIKKLSNRLVTNKLTDDQYIESLDEIDSEFNAWVSKAIISVWNTKEIQRIHNQCKFCKPPFGVYSINEQDIAPNELELMHHLTGDQL